jgi:hypothetical protein
MARKYINIFQSKPLQNLPELGFWVRKQTIWQPALAAWRSGHRIKKTRVQIPPGYKVF